MDSEKPLPPVAFGRVKSPDDYRYINLEHLAGAAPASLAAFPQSFHIDGMSAVPDMYQRQIGACTNFTAAEHFTHRFNRIAGAVVPPRSPRFLYALSKMNDGITDKTNQATFPVMPFKIGVMFGVASQLTVHEDTTLPYESYIFDGVAGSIGEAAFTEAEKFRIPGYVQVGQFNSISPLALIQALLQNPQDGVSICMPVGTEWYTAIGGMTSWQNSKVIPIRKVITQLDGHCVFATGYEIEAGTGRVKIYFRNHWSLNWASTSGIEGGKQPADIDGDNGWFYIDQHTLEEAWMTSEIPDALLAIVKSLPAQKDFSYTWNTDLAVGSQGPDVQALQIALKIAGTFPFTQAVTNYFGNITAQAVIAFQTKYGVADPATIAASHGRVGAMTRATLNKMFAHQ